MWCATPWWPACSRLCRDTAALAEGSPEGGLRGASLKLGAVRKRRPLFFVPRGKDLTTRFGRGQAARGRSLNRGEPATLGVEVAGKGTAVGESGLARGPFGGDAEAEVHPLALGDLLAFVRF